MTHTIPTPRSLFLLLAALLILNSPAVAAPANTPALLETARELHCATNGSTILHALKQLKANKLLSTGAPDQWNGSNKIPELHAATLDIVISTIFSSIEKYPPATQLAESVLLGWNYCDVHHNGEYFDLTYNGGKLRKSAAGPAAISWHGFERLGLSRTGEGRYLPSAFKNTNKSTREQVVYNWWDIQRNQCLPHPATGMLYYQKTNFGPSKISTKTFSQKSDYPFAWSSDCSQPQVQTPVDFRLAAALPEPLMADKTQTDDGNDEPIQAGMVVEIPDPVEITDNINTPAPTPIDAIKPDIKVLPAPLPGPLLPQVLFEELPYTKAAATIPPDTTADNLVLVPPQGISVSIPGVSTPSDAQEAKINKQKSKGLSGSFAMNNKNLDLSSDLWSFTTNISFKPIKSSYYFTRTGFTVSAEEDEEFTYYWGIGYNDWHTGTWAFELNNWEPLKPGDGLKIESAVASVSYKFDLPALNRNALASTLSISGGKNTSATATIAGSWSPKPNWFVRTLITQPLNGDNTTWAYGFGYSDWRAKTWAFEYNNWGTNKAFDPNFKENGLVTVSWKWGF